MRSDSWRDLQKSFLLSTMMLFSIACSSFETAELVYAEGIDPEGLELSYYSDYFSFVGHDGDNLVAFAIDNNRGRDADQYKTEIFSVLYVESQGWVNVNGQGMSENSAKQLVALPNTKAFSFNGDARSGLVITGESNGLELVIEGIPETLNNEQGSASYSMGGAPAVLTLHGRQIEGRVIYESLFLPNFNRLTRSYFGLFNDFHGLYLYADGLGDFYFHYQKSQFIKPLLGEYAGFVGDGDVGEIKYLELSDISTKFALGFYRWPDSWSGKFVSNGVPYSFTISLQERNTVANWLIGGFAMGIARGTLTDLDSGKSYLLIGLAELII
jgi:hypothetical protein